MLAFGLTAALIFALLGLLLALAFRAHALPYRHAFAAWGLLLVLSSVIYLSIGDIDSLLPRPESVATSPGAIDLEQLASGVLMVEREVAEDPTYALGWLMLARSYWLLQRADASAQAYENYHSLEAGDVSSWLSHAQALLALEAPEPVLALGYFNRVLQQDASNLSALGFAGYAATMLGDHQAAIDYWETLLSLVQADPEASALLQEQIDNLKAQVE